MCHINESTVSNDFRAENLHKNSFQKRMADGDSTSSLVLKWDESIQGRLLSVYALGYIVGNLSGGTICALMGAKNYMTMSMAVTGSLQMLSPVAAVQWNGHWFLCSLRFLFGACVSIYTF